MTHQSTSELIKEVKTLYNAIGSIKCQPLKEDIVFNKQGWKHLMEDGHKHRRKGADLRNRLRLFKLVPNALRRCTWVGLPEIRIQNGIAVTYYEAYYTETNSLNTEYITIVIRKFDIGPYHYYSIRSENKWFKKQKNPKD